MSGGQVGAPMVFESQWRRRRGRRPALPVLASYAMFRARVIAPWSVRTPRASEGRHPRPEPGDLPGHEIMYGRAAVPDDPDFVVPIGKAKVEKSGSDVTIVAFSICVSHALDAAARLAAEGIDAEVINLRSIRPLDIDTIIQSVQKTNRLITVEEGWAACGIGSEIAAQTMEAAFDFLDAPVHRVAGEDVLRLAAIWRRCASKR